MNQDITVVVTEDNEWYYLDPDNRKDKPSVTHCACCLRPIKATQAFESFKRIIIHPTAYPPLFRIAGLKERDSGMIGSHCLSRLIKEFGIIKL